MNISINNTTFNGSREVTYGLMMAAKEARNVEICKALMQGPRPLNRATEGRTSEALTKAYMNMATFDDSFYSTLEECDDVRELGAVLKPEKLQYSKTNPLNLFKRTMLNCLREHNKAIDTDILDNFFKKVEGRIIFTV